MRTGLTLMKNVLTPLTTSVLIPLGLTAAATNAVIQKKLFVFFMTALKISNEDMDDIIKIVESFEESGLLVKGASETIKNIAKKQNSGILPTLLGTLTASLFPTFLSSISKGKEVKRGSDRVSGQVKEMLDLVNFDSFGVKHISKEIKKIILKENIITNNYRELYD